jgi:hypothetical protein
LTFIRSIEYPEPKLSQGGISNGSLLYEMPRQERDEESQESDHEEWETGDKWCLSEVRDQDVQDWEGLETAIYKYKGT